MNVIRPVVLSGGSGTRLWPLSGSATPKQFLDLFGSGSLFENTLSRLNGIPGSTTPIVVTGEPFLATTLQAIEGVPSQLIVEPAGRNTTAAIIAAAMTTPRDHVLIISPSDHLISDTTSFIEAALSAIDLTRDGHVVTMGVVPEKAETGYGYIEKGEQIGVGFRVRNFHEKPSESEAVRMAADPNYLWNAGLFVATSGSILDEANQHCPAIAATVEESLKTGTPMSERGYEVLRLGDGFTRAESVPFDKAIMEKTSRGLVVALDAGWSDIGSWEAMWNASEQDASGNSISGVVELVDVERSYVTAATQPVAVIGLDDVVVVETGHGVLVTRRDRSQDVRDVAGRLESRSGAPDG